MKERVQGDPRRPGGLPHEFRRIIDIWKSMWHHAESVRYRTRRSLLVGVKTSHPVAVTTTVSSIRMPPTPSR
jgi:hypothetical protein